MMWSSSTSRRLFCALLACLALSSPGTITAAAVGGGSAGAADRGDDDSANVGLDPRRRTAALHPGGGNDEPNIAERGSSAGASFSRSPSDLIDPTLDEHSVVLITGAAGFLGSELALALRRTYDVKKLLLVDDLGIDSENESAYVPPPMKDGSGGSGAIYEKLSEDKLSAFEVKRQRAFRIFHELTAPSYLDDDTDDVGGTNGVGVKRRKRDDAAESVRFYRADMRPSIPEFFDFGEVPLLEGIFQSHPDITHVVHLADVPLKDQNQAIPRNKDSVKTGRMEGLLEEFRLIIERAAEDGNEDSVRLPQFVYASSHEVYDRISTAADGKATPQQPNPPPFREDKPITTPSSLHGTAKLIDEVLASAYHSTHGIYSVGLRFFHVYGPWDSQGTAVVNMSDRLTYALAEDDGIADPAVEANDDAFDGDVDDYVYIDDAVDALLAAMQYRPPGEDPPPVVFNVGTGRGSTLKEVKEEMARHVPKYSKSQNARSAKENPAGRLATTSYASTSRSESLLGFRAQVSLEEGLARTLAWQLDRANPYGRDPNVEDSFERRSAEKIATDSLAKARGESCGLLDRECLRGAPIFPCASECGRAGRCTPSAWDDVAHLSRMVTSGCDAVLYTILLDNGAEQIPSAAAAGGGAVSSSGEPASYVGAGLTEDVGRRTQARCNVAFVSERSPLVQRLRSEGEEYVDEGDEGTGSGGSLPPLLRHGFWTVLPVSTQASDSGGWMHAFDGTWALEYLPKVSPGGFFGPSVRYAVYADPSVVVEDLPSLLRTIEAGPPGGDPGSTVLAVPRKRPGCDPLRRGSSCSWSRPTGNNAVQRRAYDMIRVALRGDILGGGPDPVLDTSLVAHALGGEDQRLFRCDAFGEAAQWGAGSDVRALEFILSLHDLWSRALVHWSGGRPWWIDGVSAKENQDAKDEASEKEGSGKQGLLEDASAGELVGSFMGILSSVETQIFAHILPSQGMGIVHLDD